MRPPRSSWVVAALLSTGTLVAGQGQTPTFRAVAEAVAVPVSVRDKGRPVSGLKAADFELTDNGVRQDVATVALSAVPIDVTILLDTSGSVAGDALAQFKSDVQTMSNALERTDRIRLLTFADSVADVFGLQPGGTSPPLDKITSGGITQFYSALAAAMVTVSTEDRPQLVMAFTDGRDSESFLDVDHVIALAPFSHAALFMVLLESTSSFEQGATKNVLGRALYTGHGAFAGGPNRSALRTLAQRTGGALYERPAGESLPTIFTKLLEDFRTGYVLTYIPAGVPRPGWHELHVQTKQPSYVIRARDGYDGG
jgi:VWFA-related protein